MEVYIHRVKKASQVTHSSDSFNNHYFESLPIPITHTSESNESILLKWLIQLCEMTHPFDWNDSFGGVRMIRLELQDSFRWVRKTHLGSNIYLIGVFGHTLSYTSDSILEGGTRGGPGWNPSTSKCCWLTVPLAAREKTSRIWIRTISNGIDQSLTVSYTTKYTTKLLGPRIPFTE